MMETILAFLGTTGGKTTLISLGIYALSLFSNSEWYKTIREAIGRGAEAAGVALSALGNSKLGFLWNPTEKVLCDFLIFTAEQFAVGLRKDNPEKLEAQLERLESVGSQSRADALAVKIGALEAMPAAPRDRNDAEVMAQVVAAAEASTSQHLKE